MFYSAATGGIYHPAIHASFPNDAVELSDADYKTLMAGQVEGKAIIPGPGGRPMLAELPTPNPADELLGLYDVALADINRGCEQSITSGFLSDALGDLYQYSSSLEDQLNLTTAILREVDMTYACRDGLGVKDFRQHTVAQLRQVGDDFTLFKMQMLQKANDLKQQLDSALAAGDRAALVAVTWEIVQP